MAKFLRKRRLRQNNGVKLQQGLMFPPLVAVVVAAVFTYLNLNILNLLKPLAAAVTAAVAAVEVVTVAAEVAAVIVAAVTVAVETTILRLHRVIVLVVGDSLHLAVRRQLNLKNLCGVLVLLQILLVALHPQAAALKSRSGNFLPLDSNLMIRSVLLRSEVYRGTSLFILAKSLRKLLFDR